MKKSFLALLLLIAASLSGYACREGELHVVTTGDVHGRYFSRRYENGERTVSLMSVKYYVDSLRTAVGEDNVILLDCGDILQGDNSSYYYNFVATDVPHVYPRMASYMGYDACVVGNHDTETGHPVYDRVRDQLRDAGIPWLAGNAFKPDGDTYFQEYTVIRKKGRKILIMGYNNANIDHWLVPELWSGMKHESLIPLVQQRVDRLSAMIKPDVVIVAVHSGVGKGDGSSNENQGLDIFNSLTGVDVLVCAHDHNPAVYSKPGCVLVDGGARCANVGHAVLKMRGRKVVDRRVETVRMKRNLVDLQMEKAFNAEWEAVRDFTVKPVGNLGMTVRTRDAYMGMNPYVDLLNTVMLSASGAQVSLAAPLTYNGTVNEGPVRFGDLFTLYPFENTLYVLNMTGAEIHAALEYSYDHWITTPGEHVLKIKDTPDARTGAVRWSFVNRPYNFDSAAGLVYTVDVTKPNGSRVCITSLADGSPFDESATYEVAMTSYRATGGGSILTEGAGIDHAELGSREVRAYPEIRDLLYSYFLANGEVGPALFEDRSVLGEWKFVPETVVLPLLESDMGLVF